MKAPIAVIILLSFLVSGIMGPVPVYAQDDFRLPAPGAMVRLSPSFDPPILKGIKVHTDDPFRFDFILDKGDSRLSGSDLKDESTKLIKYFLATLTIPEKDLWVNLSPYENNRIIPNSFGLTEMGRDLLAEDYMLKQITASLIYPEGEIGKKFWKRIYEEAARRFGTTNVPVNTFNKVWIIPDKAVVYENAKAGTAYVVESNLKVMLEQDYLSARKHSLKHSHSDQWGLLGSNIVREIVIPELTREVNEDKNFIKLRQVYNSLILAAWYKKKIKDSILEKVYADKKKVSGVGYRNSLNIETIYQRYLQAFKKGVYNYIKEEADPVTQEVIPRKYFSGGINYMDFANQAMTIIDKPNSAMTGIIKRALFSTRDTFYEVAVHFNSLQYRKGPAIRPNTVLSKANHKATEGLIEEWNGSTIEQRAQMIVKSKDPSSQRLAPYRNPDFLMYVLLDSPYSLRRAVVEINNWGAIDESKVNNIPLKDFTENKEWGPENGLKIVKWLVDHNVLEEIPASLSGEPELRLKQNILLEENELRRFMGDHFNTLMDIFYYNWMRSRSLPEKMPSSYLLHHLSNPGISMVEYGPPKSSGPVGFNAKIGFANKRMAILIMIMQRVVNGEHRNKIGYEKRMARELDREAGHLGEWSKDLDPWFKHLMDALNNGDRNILGENKQMDFWEAFCRVYVIFKWFHQNPGLNNPYGFVEPYLYKFEESRKVPNIHAILNQIDRKFDAAMQGPTFTYDGALGRRAFVNMAAGLFALAAAPKLSAQEAKPDVTVELIKLIFKAPEPLDDKGKGIRSDLVRLFTLNEKGREAAFERLKKASSIEDRQAIIQGLVDVINSGRREIFYSQSRKLLLSLESAGTIFNDINIVRAFFQSFNSSAHSTDSDALQDGKAILVNWLNVNRDDGVFDVLTTNWLSSEENDRTRLAQSLAEGVKPALSKDVRAAWGQLIQKKFDENKIKYQDAFRVLRFLYADDPENLKGMFNKGIVGEQEEIFFNAFADSKMLTDSDEYELHRKNLVKEAESLFQTGLRESREGKVEDQDWYKKLNGDRSKASAYLTVHYLAALVITQDKMQKDFGRSGINITNKQMKELSRRILSEAFVSDIDNATGDFEFGTGFFKRIKKLDFLIFYFHLFHELSHNFHDLWGENFGIDIMSEKSLKERVQFDVEGATALVTMSEYLADMMAIYVTTQLGLEEKRTKQITGNLRRSDINYARHEMLKEIFEGFPSPRASPAYLKDLGIYLAGDVYVLFRHFDFLVFPWRIEEQHLKARQFVKEIMNNPKAMEQIPGGISKAYDLIGQEAARVKEKGSKESWKLSWRRFQQEIRAVWADKAMTGKGVPRRGFLRMAAAGVVAAWSSKAVKGQSFGRPSDFKPDLYQQALTQAGNFILNARSPSKMVQSYINLTNTSDPSYNTMWVYNGAQAVNALIGTDQLSRIGSGKIGFKGPQMSGAARGIADGLLLLMNKEQLKDGSTGAWWFNGYDLSTRQAGNPQQLTRDVGATATVIRVLAALGDPQYVQAAQEAMDYIIENDLNSDGVYDFFMGGQSYQNGAWVKDTYASTENNCRLIMALYALYRNQNVPQDKREAYKGYAQGIAQWLVGEMWDGREFSPGYDLDGDTGVFSVDNTSNQRTDAQFMPIIALQTAQEILFNLNPDSRLNPQNYMSAINNLGPEHSISYGGQGVLGWAKVSNNTAPQGSLPVWENDPDSIWLEGTLEGVSALYILGQTARADSILKSISGIQNGGLPSIIDGLNRADANNFPLWPYNFPYLAVDATSALISALQYRVNSQGNYLVKVKHGASSSFDSAMVNDRAVLLTAVGVVHVPGRTATISDFDRTIDDQGRPCILVYRGLKNVRVEEIRGKSHQSLAALNGQGRDEAYKRYGGSITEAVLYTVGHRNMENDPTLHTTLNPEIARNAARIGNGVVVTYRIPIEWVTQQKNKPILAQKGDVEEEVAFYYDLPPQFVYQIKQVSNTGGIDLTPANMNLQTQNAGEEIKFHLDPAMLKQLQNAPGFTPVIINIQPMKNLEIFLGLAEEKDIVNHS